MSEPKELEQLVQEVDYYFLNYEYKPSLPALAFINFIKLVNGAEGEENKTPVIHLDMIDHAASHDDNLYVSFRGSAKALALDEKVLTPDGSKYIKDIRVGDLVIDRNGDFTKVIAESEIFNKPMYKLHLEDGRTLKVSEDHLNIVHKVTTGGKFKEEVLTTKEIIDKGVHYKRKVCDRNPTGRETKWYIPLNGEINYPTQSAVIDPYTAGILLGDGSIGVDGYSRVHTHVGDAHELMTYIPYETTTLRADKRNADTVRFSVRGIGSQVKEFIGTSNCYGKRIPKELLIGDSKQRLETLKGLMDTDGTVSKEGHTCSFTTVSPMLAEGVAHLVRSLGGRAKVVFNTWASGQSYRVHILSTFNPFKLKRKADLWKPCTTRKVEHVGIQDIEFIPQEPSKCIGVSSNTHSFLTEKCVVTHNTTALHEYMYLYLATYGEFFDFGQVDVAMYISDTIDNGVKSMRKNLQFRWENSDFLQKYVPTANFTDVRWEFINLAGKKFCVRGFGASTGVRGFKEYGQRPTWCGYDDLMSDKNAESPTIIKDIKNIIYKAARQAMHPKKRKIIWTGTPFNKRDPLYAAAGSKGWAAKVYPICEKFPCSREEFRGAWEDRFTYDFVKKEYDTLLDNGEIAAFNQELMLRITSEEDRLVQDGDIRWYKRAELIKNQSAFNFYITTDFATSEKQSSDLSVISVWAYSSGGQWFLVDGICKRQLMNQNVDDLFRLAQMYKPQLVGIEVSGQQGGFIPWIQSEMMKRNIWFSLASDNNSNQPGIRPTTQKLTRFNTIAPWFKQGLIHFPEEYKGKHALVTEMVEEVSLVTYEGFKSKHDDAADTLSMLASLKAWKPSESTPMKQTEEGEEIWGFEEDDESNALDSYVV